MQVSFLLLSSIFIKGMKTWTEIAKLIGRFYIFRYFLITYRLFKTQNTILIYFINFLCLHRFISNILQNTQNIMDINLGLISFYKNAKIG